MYELMGCGKRVGIEPLNHIAVAGALFNLDYLNNLKEVMPMLNQGWLLRL